MSIKEAHSFSFLTSFSYNVICSNCYSFIYLLLFLPYEHPIEHEWKLKKSELEALKDSTKKDLFSSDYYVSKILGINYHFAILPYGSEDYPMTEGNTWIYLHLDPGDNVKEVQANFNISINSANIFKTVEHIFKESLAKGKMFCRFEEFFDPANNYFVNDEIVVNINGTLKFDRPFVSKIAYPILAKTAFKADDLDLLRTEDGENLESETFDVLPSSDIKYYIRIYSNDPDEIIIALFMTFENYKKLKTHLTFGINSVLYTKSGYQLVESGHGYGFVLCSTEDFFDLTKGYIIDGKTTITLEGHLFVEKKNSEFKLMNDDTVSLTSKNQEKNFKITVGENVIAVNKDLLADVSTVFAGMLQSGMKETIEGKMEITDFPYNTVDAAIKLIYGISPTFTLDDMLPLLVFSDKYDIQLIKELVEDHLISELLPSNVCQIIHFSDIFNIPKLHEKSTEYFVKCYRELTAVNDLDLLEKDLIHKILFSAIPTLPY